MRAASRRRGDPPSRHIEHSARSEHHARQPGSARVVRARAATLQMKFGRCRRLHKGVKVSLARKKDWIALTEGDLESHERGCARGARAHCLHADRMHGSESDLLPHHHVLTDRARSPALHVQYASPPGAPQILGQNPRGPQADARARGEISVERARFARKTARASERESRAGGPEAR